MPVSAQNDLSALPPQRRAELIYAQARAELSTRLWRAALGDADGNRDAANPLAQGNMGLDSLLQLASGGGSDIPGTCQCACHCSCHAAGAAPGASAALIERATLASAIGSARSPIAGDAASAIDLLSARGGRLGGSDTPAWGSGGGATAATLAAGLGVNARHADAIAAAEARTGIPGTAIAAIVGAEAGKHRDGSWNALSRNPRSSAAGLGQFLSGTWVGLAETKGTWLNEAAAARGWIDGRGHVAPAARAELLALRYDPTASILGVADYAKINLDRLESAGLNVRADAETTAKAAYLGHHLGLGDARRFLGSGLDQGRARTLLVAQIGAAAAQQRIAAAGGNATAAHRQWLLGYIDRNVRWEPGTA